MDSDGKTHSSSSDSDEFGSTLREIIQADDKNAYVSMMNRVKMIHEDEVVKQNIVPHDYWSSILLYNALDIAKALLEGETGQIVDYNSRLEGGLPLMHYLALFRKTKLIDFFIRHGAPTGGKCVDTSQTYSNFKGMLPLNVALAAICTDEELENCYSKNSLLEILTVLCHPLKKQIVETVRVLALHTKEVEQEISYYVTEGKVVELAALLMAAREKVMVTIMSQDRDGSSSDGGMSIYHGLWNEFVALTYEDFNHSCCNQRDNFAKMCKDRKVATMSTLMLLELFEKAGDVIDAYFQQERTDAHGVVMITVEQIAQDVAWMSQEAGLVFKYPGSSRSKLHPENIKPSSFALKAKCLVEEGKLQSRDGVKNTIIGMPSQPLRFNQTTFPSASPVSCSMTRSIHSLPSSMNSQTTATVEAQVKNTIKSVDLPLPNFLLSRHWGLFALAIKRKIRAV
uniref:Ankyrin repeat family protein n=1 Tax=Davidia involucrata TaxID=16924 RepID=A0A5B6ZEN0_DAVIN